MIRVAICDDENVIVSQIDKIILEVCSKEHIPIDIDVFYSGERLKKEILMGKRYDLLILDIQMEHEDGITAAKNIRKMDENVLIIYVSGYEKYLMELFRIDVFDFVKKPICKESFIKIFLDAYEKICRNNIYFPYCYKNEEYKILCSDILYFESNGRQIKIYLRSGKIEVFYGKLNEIENKLEKGKIPFLRIHQSFLVNYQLIKARSKTKVILINEKELQISEERQKRFSQEYGKLLRGEISE